MDKSLNLQHLFEHNEILILAILIIAAISLAELAKKCHLPKVTGYIVAGIIIGAPFLNLISKDNFEKYQVINLLALGMMSITIGSHLNLHKLKISGRRILAVFLGESILAFSFVFLSFYFFSNNTLLICLLIAAISIATAPAATVAVIKDTKSKGLLVNTILPVVALNNVVCIVVFDLLLDTVVLEGSNNFNFTSLFFTVLKEFLGAILLGSVCGIILKYFSEKKIHSSRYVLTMVILTVITITGISKIFQFNLMLPCIVVGIVISNTSHYRLKILTIFEEIEYVILIVFFSLAGAHIDTTNLKVAGFLGLMYFFARGAGKILGGSLGAYLSKTPNRIYENIGIALLPQAGVAIGLVIMAGEVAVLSNHIDFLTTLILAAVALNEIFGPPATKWALSRSGDLGQDKPKLIEFIGEEYIKANIKAENKKDALNEMISFFIDSHKGTSKLKDEITKSVFEREEDMSTGIGEGIALPHGVVEKGKSVYGAIGLSKKGIEFNSIDKKPVHLIVLIVTPKKHQNEIHLDVLRQLSKLFSNMLIRESIFCSESAAEIYDILRNQEMGDFNYFLD